MKNNTSSNISTVHSSLSNCRKLVNKLSETCCMPERSSNMKILQTTLDKAINASENLEKNDQAKTECIDYISSLGEKTGFLYASCCTETREPLYQGIYKELMNAHSNLQIIMGITH